MHIIHTWAALAAYLDGPIPPDIKSLLQTRRDQLMEYDLSELGILVIIQPGDTMAAIDAAVRWPIVIDGAPTWEWVQRAGKLTFRSNHPAILSKRKCSTASISTPF